MCLLDENRKVANCAITTESVLVNGIILYISYVRILAIIPENIPSIYELNQLIIVHQFIVYDI